MDQDELAAHRSRFPDEMSLGEARRYVRERLKGGVRCPCCTRVAALYKRSLNHKMILLLSAMVRAGGRDRYVHAQDTATDYGVGQVGGDVGKLLHFGLVERHPEKRGDGGGTGWWKVTETGEKFLRDEVTLPKYVVLYDNRLRGFEGAQVTVHDVYQERFDFRKLMEESAA